MKYEDDNDFEEEEDISLQMLREEEREVEDYPEEEGDKKQVFIYVILGVITIVLCGISLIIGLNMGRSLERKQNVMKEETILSSNLDSTKQITNLDSSMSAVSSTDKEEKTAQREIEKSEIEIKEVDKSASSEFMILQNAKATGVKTPEPQKTDSAVVEKSGSTATYENKETSKPAPTTFLEETKESSQTFPQADGKYFTIQIAATEDRNQAETLKTALTDKGYDAYISTVDVRDKTFYRVRVGRYAAENEAMHAADSLKSKENLKNDIWITSM
ncbi:SPOR domain-containing protein [bacterium]|nr:SPOR domain-containing protein [bacterium]